MAKTTAKKTAKKKTTKKASRSAGFTTKVESNVPNADVPDRVAKQIGKPKYVTHNLLPVGNGKTTIIFIFRK